MGLSLPFSLWLYLPSHKSGMPLSASRGGTVPIWIKALARSVTIIRLRRPGSQATFNSVELGGSKKEANAFHTKKNDVPF